MIQLKSQLGGDMALLDIAHTIPEQLRLREALLELLAREPLLHSEDLLRVVEVAAFLRRHRRQGIVAVRPVVDFPGVIWWHIAPSRWLFITGHTWRLMGSSCQFAPRRESCESK